MKFIKKNLKWVTVALIFCLLIGGIFCKYFLLKQENVKPIEEDTTLLLEEDSSTEEEEEEIKKVFVDIKGAVNNPGVYEIEETKKVMDVVLLAGGFTEQADSSLVNLAKKVEDEMVIIIYTIEEVKKAGQEDSVAKIVDKQCVCPTIKNDACITNQSSSNDDTQSYSTNTNQKINLNTASLEELESLSGIGESKAEAIIDYRETVGKFETIEELKEVSGIGEALYEKIKDNITV